MNLDEIIDSSAYAYYWFYQWPTISKNDAKEIVQWCIVSESSGLYDDKYESFKFDYNGETYYILYEIIPET